MTAPARTQKQRREEAEAALLDAAAELVAEQGLRALTLARVGERAGYSRGLVTHYFGSKQALVERLARAAQSGFVPGLADLPPGPDRLLRLIDGYLAQQTKHERPLNRAFLLLWMEAATSPTSPASSPTAPRPSAPTSARTSPPASPRARSARTSRSRRQRRRSSPNSAASPSSCWSPPSHWTCRHYGSSSRTTGEGR